MGTSIMSEAAKQSARDWYAAHRSHVNQMLRERGPRVEPTGLDAVRPELWKDIHWRWFMTMEVEKQLFR